METLPKRQVFPLEPTREMILREIDKIIGKINEIIEVINFRRCDKEDSL